ncbi:LacI family DNA-binding transcriptional regulator [Herbiconiux sp. A18JL235]|uniref:LacI family DNA-binding transcriptional regulator n=1 Tax=Herbiconiux sp. A18JL235 TaxID=3152363 RepID=A0AB39BER1_9MICO
MIDVARLAGVSHQTVSRVLNGSDSVTPEMRERVETAVDRLRYRRNPAARALVTRQSMSIGIVSFGLAQFGPSVALTGIVDEARRAGYATNLVSLTALDHGAMQNALDHLMADSVDGVIVLAPLEAALVAIGSLSPEVPLVVFHPGGPATLGTIATDEVAGARLATVHLIELGHGTVHHVSGPPGWLGTAARLEGWRGALADAGLPAHPPVEGDWTSESGYDAGIRFADDHAVTAVFAANDQMALGVVRALVDSGRQVPGEVSVIGFDDVPESAFFRPALSTVRFDFSEVGRQAVDHVLELMAGRQPAAPRPVAPQLLGRTSTAPPPRTNEQRKKRS